MARLDIREVFQVVKTEAPRGLAFAVATTVAAVAGYVLGTVVLGQDWGPVAAAIFAAVAAFALQALLDPAWFNSRG